jgi:hypothetical protein
VPSDGQVTAQAGDEPATTSPPATTTLAINFFNMLFLPLFVQGETLSL